MRKVHVKPTTVRHVMRVVGASAAAVPKLKYCYASWPVAVLCKVAKFHVYWPRREFFNFAGFCDAVSRKLKELVSAQAFLTVQ